MASFDPVGALCRSALRAVGLIEMRRAAISAKIADPCGAPTPCIRFVMNSSSERVLTELLIARALVNLSSIPAESLQPTVTLASIGNCEIRMFLGKQAADVDGVSLFWLELLDYGTNLSVDSVRCSTIREAAPVFEHMMSQAACLNRADPDSGEAE
jgi:hypothetical protein